MKKTLLLLLILCTTFLLVPQNALADDLSDLDLLGNDATAVNVDSEAQALSGSCGDNVFWSYDSDSKTLTISGQGAMNDYYLNDIPWRKYTIENIIIANGITRIGNYAFYNSSVSNVNIPGSVISIGTFSFASCDKLKNLQIENGIMYIEMHAFRGCGFERIYIPESIVRIEDYVFDDCLDLCDIVVDTNNESYTSYDGALYSKGGKELLVCPAGIDSIAIHSGTVTIQAGAFHDCKNLKKVIMPDSIIEIAGSYIFSDCELLEHVILSKNLEGLGWRLFDNCTNLNEINIPDGITTLDSTFSGCTNLRVVYIPASVVELRTNTFYHCYNLERIFYSGSEQQWNKIKIEDGNAELGGAEIIFQGGTATNPPDDKPDDDKPVTPDVPEKLPVVSQPGGLGSKITVQVTGEHWLTVQVRRAGSIALTSIQAQGQGLVEAGFSAAAGSIIQIWETEEEMSFTDGVPENKILATVVENI